MKSGCLFFRRFCSFLVITTFYLTILNGQNKPTEQTLENVIWYNKPAKEWLQALPIGNGRLGAMVYGDPENEHLQLNEDSMWPGKMDQGDSRGNAKDLQRIRTFLDEGNPHAADSLIVEAFSYKGVVRSHQTMGDLYLRFHRNRTITNYRRELSLDKALVTVSYLVGKYKFTERVFSSAVDDVLVIELTTDDPGGISCDALLSRPEDYGRATVHVSNPAPNEISMFCRVTQYGGRIHSVAVPMDYGIQFETRLRAAIDRGTVTSEEGQLHIRGGQKVYLYIAGNTAFYHADFKRQNQVALDAVTERMFEDLLTRHIHDFSYYFGRVSLSLGDSDKSAVPVDERLASYKSGGNDPGLVSLLFQYGRYLLVSCSRPGSSPANLQGLWNPYIEAPWNADYHLNINLEMNYWPAEVTNLSEMHQPLFDFSDRLMHRGTRTAREQYGIKRGTVAHQATDIWAPAWMQAEQPYWGAWIHGAGWLSLHYWEHFQFTRDTGFLRHRAYPALKNCAAFYLDWLQMDTVSGKWISYPETSPENSYIASDGRPAAVSRGAAMGYQIIHDVFAHTLAAAKILGVDEELTQEIKDKIEKTHPGVVIGDDGRILEWDKPYPEHEKGHRHMSHLYALFPGANITSSQSADFNAARKSIDYRLQHGGAGTGWSRAWMICFEARLMNSKEVYNNVHAFVSTAVAENLFALHPPFQIDANFGFTAGIAEALLQSHEGFIRLLPALPEEWKDGQFTGLKARGNVTVDTEWKMGVLKTVRFQSPIAQTITIKYKNISRDIILESGKTAVLDTFLNHLN